MKRVALFVLTVVACGDNPEPTPTVSVSVHLDGHVIAIEAECPERWKVQALDEVADCSLSKPAVLRIGADRINAGAHTIAVTATGEGKTITKYAALDIPAAAIGPFFALEDCTGDYRSDDEYPRISIANGSTSLDCRTFPGARANVRLRVNTAARLRIAGHDVPVPASGRIDTVIDLGDAIMNAAIGDLARPIEEDKTAQLSVPWQLESGTASLEGNLTVTERVILNERLLGIWLRDLVTGKVERRAFKPLVADARPAMVLVDEDLRTTVLGDFRGKVGDLDLVAISREVSRTESGVCTYDRPSITAPRVEIVNEVTVTSLADGRVVASRRFTPPAGCPSMTAVNTSDPEVKVRANDEDVMTWLATIGRTKR